MSKTYFIVLKDVSPGGLLELKMEKFDDTLETLQRLVDGTIEHFVIDDELDEHFIDMWINDEGKFREDFKPKFALFHDGKLYDVIVGPCVFTMYDLEGETHGLTEDAMRRVREFLYKCPLVTLKTREGKMYTCLRVDK